MDDGMAVLQYYKDPSTGELKPWEGKDNVDGLITTDLIQCTAAGVAIATVTSGFNAYVTSLLIYNSNGAAQTLTLADAGGNKFIIGLATLANLVMQPGGAFLKLDAGVVTGTAGTGDHMNVCMSYYER